MIGPLSTKMYCAIGMVAVAWAQLDEVVALCLSRMLGADHVEFLAINSHIQGRGRLEALKSLGAHKLPAEQAVVLANFCDQAMGLARERNKIQHGSWLQGETPDIAIRFTYRTQGRITAAAPTITAQEIAGLADQINTVSAKLSSFLEQMGLFDPIDPLDRRKARPIPPHMEDGP
ncbi:hypothetical protein [Azospirillum sp.]|uniref:hypothetical protein n=1 Tax=Azospirillum sp. TaxID=34012 RepID=UPI0026073B06|nr:hypothetical protein [Azospirillum sp.]